MPDPDPQSPKPRGIFPFRWLLLLLPTALANFAVSMLFVGKPAAFFAVLAAAGMLCFALGFLLERWLRGATKSIVWAFNYGFMILIVNFAVWVLFFIPKLR